MTRAEQHKLLREDLVRAEQAGLVFKSIEKPNLYSFRINTVTVDNHKDLGEYLWSTYPDVVVTIAGREVFVFWPDSI